VLEVPRLRASDSRYTTPSAPADPAKLAIGTADTPSTAVST
jgi:hypothetical protein